MAKGSKGQVLEFDPKSQSQVIVTKPPKSVQFRDHYCRLNYLFQVSSTLQLNNQTEHSRICLKNMSSIAGKTTTKLKPVMKRTICKKCTSLLIPGLNCEIRLVYRKNQPEEPQNQVLQVKCCQCERIAKRYPIGKDPDYVLFSENPNYCLPVD